MDGSRYSLHFERTEPCRNMARYYSLSLEPSLLGRITLVRRWGRIGTLGHCRSDCFDSEVAGIAAMLALARSKRGRGYRLRTPTELTAVNSAATLKAENRAS